MANLTFLNDGSVFHNLEVRYKAKLIYTCKYNILQAYTVTLFTMVFFTVRHFHLSLTFMNKA